LRVSLVENCVFFLLDSPHSQLTNNIILHSNTRFINQSLEGQQFHLENQGGIGWNQSSQSLVAIGQLWRTCENGLFANAHLGDALIPSFDHFSLSEVEVERFSPANRRVENSAIGESANVVDSHPVSGGWTLSIASPDGLFCYFHYKRNIEYAAQQMGNNNSGIIIRL
jgi:hypothetical protein